MLDSKSLDTISRLKSALLIREQNKRTSDLPLGNRGKKIAQSDAKINTLTPKIVEYNGTNHMVLTNDVIERTNYHNKRRWSDFYRNGERGNSSRLEESPDSSDSELSEDDNPFKKLRLSELLAPLYHPSEISTHPAISKTFKSGCLATLAAELIEVIELEQKTLNQFNRLLQVLDGEDWFYQLEENMDLPAYDHGLDETEKAETEETKDEENVVQAENTEASNIQEKNDTEKAGGTQNEVKEESDRRVTRNARAETEPPALDPFFALPKSLEIFESQQQKQREETEDDDELVAIQQELINYLQVSIQRQHEYIKNLSNIRSGLVKADRYKKDLYRWSREVGEKK